MDIEDPTVQRHDYSKHACNEIQMYITASKSASIFYLNEVDQRV